MFHKPASEMIEDLEVSAKESEDVQGGMGKGTCGHMNPALPQRGRPSDPFEMGRFVTQLQ
jgi:hypothetical protein